MFKINFSFTFLVGALKKVFEFVKGNFSLDWLKCLAPFLSTALVKVKSFFDKKTIIVTVVSFALGFGTCFLFYRQKVEVPVEVTKTEVQTQVVHTVDTEIKYVEKEKPTDADVEIQMDKPTVQVNGQTYTFDPVGGESHSFQNGHLQLHQQYQISIKHDEDIPKWGTDVVYSNHGVKLSAERYFSKNFGAVVEGTLDKKDGHDRYYGVGLHFNF